MTTSCEGCCLSIVSSGLTFAQLQAEISLVKHSPPGRQDKRAKNVTFFASQKTRVTGNLRGTCSIQSQTNSFQNSIFNRTVIATCPIFQSHGPLLVILYLSNSTYLLFNPISNPMSVFIPQKRDIQVSMRNSFKHRKHGVH